MAGRSALHLHHTDAQHRVTSLELFFDLVFVLALTQVTTYLAAHLSPHGALRGALVLGVMWWSWTGYAWLTNYVRADHGAVRLMLVVVMAAGLIMTLTIPEAFDDLDGRPPAGPLVFVGAYFVLRAMHLAIFFVAGRDDPQLRRTLTRFAVPFALGTGLLTVAAFTSGPTQTLLWVGALVGDAGGTILLNAGGWRLTSAGHFAERHGLIVILALGESLVAVGVGAQGLSLTWAAMAAAIASLVVVACLWWIYFDVVAGVAERRLASLDGADRASLARDSYSYLHFPMVAGIIFVALGLKKTLASVADAEHHHLGEPLHGMPLLSLYGGIAVYLLAHVAFRLRNIGSVNWRRLTAAGAMLALAWPVRHEPALLQLGLAGVVLLVLCSYESLRFRAWRESLQHGGHDPDAEHAPRGHAAAVPVHADEHDHEGAVSAGAREHDHHDHA